MPIDNFEDWEQAVLDRKMSSLKEEIEESIPSTPSSKRPLTPFQFRLKKLGQLVAILSVVGGIFLVLVYQFPERLEPAISFIENLYVQLQGR